MKDELADTLRKIGTRAQQDALNMGNCDPERAVYGAIASYFQVLITERTAFLYRVMRTDWKDMLRAREKAEAELAALKRETPAPTPPSETCPTCKGTSVGVHDRYSACLDLFHVPTQPPSEDEERRAFEAALTDYSDAIHCNLYNDAVMHRAGVVRLFDKARAR